jgi:hypothetical protein
MEYPFDKVGASTRKRIQNRKGCPLAAGTVLTARADA